jgi:hypothetical protein
VDRRQQAEGVPQRQVPPQLAALAEDGADPAREASPFAGRLETAHPDVPGRRDQDPGQHLDRRRLAGSVGADVADAVARRDAEGHPVDGRHGVQGAPQPTGLAAYDEVAAQVADVDDHEPAPT